MYVVELAFSDDPARLEGRPAHRDRIAVLHEQGICILAGPLEGDAGALLVFDVDSEEDVHEAMESDPYYVGPGVTVASIRRWDLVVGPAGT